SGSTASERTMGEPLKNFYGPQIPRRIGEMIRAAWPEFPRDAFVESALVDYESSSLTGRGQCIARAMREHLPPYYPRAIEILLASLGSKLPPEERERGMGPFIYMPHVMFVAQFGLDHFEESM